jgi:hypothetical protein
MTVYELIQQLINYPADWQVDIHGAAKELEDAFTAWEDAPRGTDMEPVNARLEAARKVGHVPVDGVSDRDGRVVIL